MKTTGATKTNFTTYDVPGPLPFKMYCAGEGQAGGGRLIFDEMGVRAVFEPGAAWSEANAGRKGEGSLKTQDGNWSLVFILCRALVLSGTSLAESVRGLSPISPSSGGQKQAERDLRMAGKAMAMASDARLHAVLEGMKVGFKIPAKAAATEQGFIDWFGKWYGSQAAQELSAGEFTFTHFVESCTRTAMNLPADGYTREMMDFRRALLVEAKTAGGPPTKESVRLHMGSIAAKRERKSVKSKKEQGRKEVKDEESGRRSIWKNETVDTSVESHVWDIMSPAAFGRILKLAGFGWLPGAKTGRRRK